MNDERIDLYKQFEEINYIDPSYYEKFRVKRGLRNADGTGVLAGMTNISNVHGYLLSDGDKLPAETLASVRPGDTMCGAARHLARTIARRAERAATPLFRDGEISAQSYKFLNRLSDVIYLLSLKVDADSKK